MKQESSYIMKTSNIYDAAEAVELKMKQIHPKLFGLFCPVKYKLLSTEPVYVPYLFLVFHYRLVRGSKKEEAGRLSPFDRDGQIGVVFDMNEAHAFHYDLFDDLELVQSRKDAMEGRFMKARCTQQEAVRNSMECAKWQYLRKVFHAIPELTLERKQFFVRQAVLLNLECRGRQYEKFAYQDRFGAKSEHISGLRVRLNV